MAIEAITNNSAPNNNPAPRNSYQFQPVRLSLSSLAQPLQTITRYNTKFILNKYIQYKPNISKYFSYNQPVLPIYNETIESDGYEYNDGSDDIYENDLNIV